MTLRRLTCSIALAAFAASPLGCDSSNPSPDPPASRPAPKPGPTTPESAAMPGVIPESTPAATAKVSAAPAAAIPAATADKPSTSKPEPPPQSAGDQAVPATDEQKAEALLRLSQEFLDEGNKDQARFWSEHLRKTYPESEAAEKALAILKKLE